MVLPHVLGQASAWIIRRDCAGDLAIEAAGDFGEADEVGAVAVFVAATRTAGERKDVVPGE